MGIFSAFRISASGMTAERLRVDVIANNIANAYTTRTPEGGPYRRQEVIFELKQEEPGTVDREYGAGPMVGAGVRVVGIRKSEQPPRMVYNPEHPDANAQGYVAMPEINIVNEMVDMITATRAYEANVTAFNAAKSMALKALEIGR